MGIKSRYRLLDDDIRESGLDLGWAIVRTPSTAVWKSADDFEPDPETLRDFEDDELVLAVDRNVRVLTEEDPALLLAEVADALAEEIMDRLNRPWPELQVGLVLMPVVDSGAVFWDPQNRSHPEHRLHRYHLGGLRSAKLER